MKQQKSVLDIQHWETSQGVPVYFVQTPHQLNMLDVDVIFDAGSSRDGEKFGLAQLTASLLDEGAGQYSTDEIAEKFDGLGSIYNIDVNQDMAIIGFRSLTNPEYLDPTLSTFITILTDPKFPVESFERLRKQMLVGLEQMLQSPMAIARKAFVESLYGQQAYGHLVAGAENTVSKLTAEDVKNFYKKYYVSKNARIVMVGDLAAANAEEMAEKIVAALSQGEAAQPIPQMQASEKPLHKNVAFPAQQTTIVLGQLGITPNSPDYFPLALGNYILGGSGLVSRLFEEVREQRGLVYQVGSYFSPLAATGSFLVFLQTRKEEAANAIAVTQSVVGDFVKEGPTQKEIDAAKKNIIGGFPLQLSSNSDILGQLVYISFYKLPLDYLDTYRDKINNVTQSQIREAFQRHIKLNDMVVVTVGEPSAVSSVTHAPQSQKTN